MAEVTRTLPFEEAVKEIMDRVGCSECRARFIAAIERGEIESDEYAVDDQPKPAAARKKKRNAA